jgi:hypothetical protein
MVIVFVMTFKKRYELLKIKTNSETMTSCVVLITIFACALLLLQKGIDVNAKKKQHNRPGNRNPQQ